MSDFYIKDICTSDLCFFSNSQIYGRQWMPIWPVDADLSTDTDPSIMLFVCNAVQNVLTISNMTGVLSEAGIVYLYEYLGILAVFMVESVFLIILVFFVVSFFFRSVSCVPNVASVYKLPLRFSSVILDCQDIVLRKRKKHQI
jgi:hypothetical protein